jgi:hypothetical protein
VVEVLVRKAQVRQVSLPEGRAIGGVPAGWKTVYALIGGGDRLLAAPAAGGLGVSADGVVGQLQAGDGPAPGGPTLGGVAGGEQRQAAVVPAVRVGCWAQGLWDLTACGLAAKCTGAGHGCLLLPAGLQVCRDCVGG